MTRLCLFFSSNALHLQGLSFDLRNLNRQQLDHITSLLPAKKLNQLVTPKNLRFNFSEYGIREQGYDPGTYGKLIAAFLLRALDPAHPAPGTLDMIRGSRPSEDEALVSIFQTLASQRALKRLFISSGAFIMDAPVISTADILHHVVKENKAISEVIEWLAIFEDSDYNSPQRSRQLGECAGCRCLSRFSAVGYSQLEESRFSPY